MYADAGGGTISAAMISALTKAVRRAGLDDRVLGTTIFQEAGRRLREILASGKQYVPAPGSVHATGEQLIRAIEQQLDETALAEFCAFHKIATLGVDFRDLIRSTGGVAVEAHDVFNQVSQNIQQHGYEGILVLWDEMGFAIEQLLTGAKNASRNLGQEAMSLQNFVERTCATNELGKRVIFLGFTHVGITEYATRANLGEQDQNRLATVSDRFRQPNINIRLSVTETEGYHLVAGMMRRTPDGDRILQNPAPKLQRIADRMPRFSKNWESIPPEVCYNDIVAPCYPLHPTTVMVLLLLSDQIAQANRTTFYYLQNREEGGLSRLLTERTLPATADIGGSELVRINDLFHFFEQPLRSREARLMEQFDDALVRIPDPTVLELAVLRTVLILGVARVQPATTAFLGFAMCDAQPNEPGAQVLHDALKRLSDAGSLWHNAATEVWGFVGTGTVRTEIEREIDDERDLITTASSTVLFRNNSEIHREIADFLGDFDLDPSPSGIIRRVSVKVLDVARGADAIEEVNPASVGEGADWRSALIYLVIPESPQVLQYWRERASECTEPTVYFVFPQGPVEISPAVRDLIAVRRVLSRKDQADHAFRVLEAKLTRLRQDLRREFAQHFGNAGLRSGTEVVQAGPDRKLVSVESWNDLLPSIAAALETAFNQQIRVRCGTYNEWQSRAAWGAIEHVVENILDSEDNPTLRDEYLGFAEKSQEAAIVDGVLVENGFYRHNALTDKWEFTPIKDLAAAVQEVAGHLQSGTSDKEFEKLYSTLVDPPFGIPNGVVPILVALVLRSDTARIGVYYRSARQLERVKSRLAEAIVDMAKQPTRYVTRFNKLSPKQRIAFRAIGPEMGVAPPEKDDRRDSFDSFCGRVRDELIAWAGPLPEDVVNGTEFSEAQRKFLKLLRGGVPPQSPVLAEAILAVIAEDKGTHAELDSAGSETRDFPEAVRAWRELRERIDRYIDGVKASVQRQITELAGGRMDGDQTTKQRFVSALKPLQDLGLAGNPISKIVEKLNEASSTNDVALEVASAIVQKDISKLTSEDMGVATGMLKMVGLMNELNRKCSVILPSGDRRELPIVPESRPLDEIRQSLTHWRAEYDLSDDQLASVIVRLIYVQPSPPVSTGDHDADAVGSVEPAKDSLERIVVSSSDVNEVKSVEDPETPVGAGEGEA